MANVVRAALVQATWTGDTESMVAKHEEHAREAARRGAKIIGFQEVFNAPYFCQVQEPEHYRWAEPVPGRADRASYAGARARDRHGDRRAGLRGRAVRLLLQHRRRDRRRRLLPRQVPQAPHPAGEGLLGEVLLPAGQRSAGRSSTRPSAGSACTSATTGTSPRAGGNSASTAPSWSTTRRPPTAASPPTCGSWSSPRPRSPTSTSSPRSTGSASRSTATTTSTGPSYFVDPRGQFVGDVASDKDEELVVRDLDFDLIEEVRQQWAFYRDRRPDAYDGLVQP